MATPCINVQAWELTGEQGLKQGDKPWISEMFGYSFAAARLDIWHNSSYEIMLYPGYTPTGACFLITCGLLLQT